MCEVMEFETLPDLAKDDLLLSAGLPQACGDALPANLAGQEIPASSERQTLRSTSEPALASPGGEGLPS